MPGRKRPPALYRKLLARPPADLLKPRHARQHRLPFLVGDQQQQVSVARPGKRLVAASVLRLLVSAREVAPQHAVGTALPLQTSIGFLLTTVTIHLVPELVAIFGWPWAFPFLALGPAAGIAAIRRLSR